MPTTFRAQQAIEALCDQLVADGKMAPTVPADAVMLLQSRVTFPNDVAMIDGVPLATALENWCAAAAHRQPPKVDADLDMNNLGDRAKAQASMRPDLFLDLLKAWGLNGPGDTKRGTRPVSANGGAAKPDKSNPWANDPANVDSKTGRYTANALTRMGQLVKTDPAMAARLAKACGVVIGAVRPAA